MSQNLQLTTYVSGDELNRVDAYDLGFHDICQHPREIATLKPSDVLAIDFDNILFHDRDAAIHHASQAVQQGVVVGIHTYYPGDPRLRQLRQSPNVIVAKNLARLHKKLVRHAKLLGRSKALVAASGLLVSHEVHHAHNRPHVARQTADALV